MLARVTRPRAAGAALPASAMARRGRRRRAGGRRRRLRRRRRPARARCCSPSAGCPGSPMAAQCGEVEVPEDRARPDGRRDPDFRRRAARQHADPEARPAVHPRRRPGPGGVAPRAVRRRSSTGVRKDRDIVLVDQRGTGRSVAARPAPRSSSTTATSKPRSNSTRCRARRPAPRNSPRGASTRPSTRPPRGSPISTRCAPRSATTASTSGAARTARAWRWNTRGAIRIACAAWCSTASRRRDMRISLDIWPTRDAVLDAVLAACARSARLPRRASGPRRARSPRSRDRLGAGRDVELADPRTGEVRTPEAQLRPRHRRRCSRSPTCRSCRR